VYDPSSERERIAAWKQQGGQLGLTERQRRLLDLEAVYRGTQYDLLRPWDPPVQRIAGVDRFVPCCERKPSVRVGLITDKADKLLDRLVGDGRMPAFAGLSRDVERALLDELDIEDASYLPSLDLVIKGSGALGFARPKGGRFEPLYLDTTWCEPLFVCHAGESRAAEIAAEMKALGVPLMPVAKGDHLAVPKGAESQDLCFLRYEYPYDREEVVAGEAYATKTRTFRRRRDYLPNVIVVYRDVEISDGMQAAAKWELAESPKPHNWGVVPIEWARSRGARPGETEGPSAITPELESIGRSADYAESMKHDAVKLLAWPQLIELDVDEVGTQAAAEYGMQTTQSSQSSQVLRYRSHMQKQGEVKALEIQGTGIESAQKHIGDLRGHADRISGVLEHDQTKAAGVLSGVAMERMLEPTIARVKAYRKPLTGMFKGLARKIAIVLGAEQQEPTVTWPRVVAMTPADLVQAAQALTVAAGGQPVLSQKTAVMLFANLAEIDDAEKELGEVQSDAEAAMKRARDALAEADAGAVDDTELDDEDA
jgi:hypothetical protein